MEYLGFSTAFGRIGGGKDAIKAKLLQYIIHYLVLEFHSIARQYESGAHMDGEIIADKEMDNSVHFFVRNWKSCWPSNQMVNDS